MTVGCLPGDPIVAVEHVAPGSVAHLGRADGRVDDVGEEHRGEPTLAVWRTPSLTMMEIGIAAASPTHWLSAYRWRLSPFQNAWRSVYQGTAPSGPAQIWTTDYCTGQGMLDGTTTACRTLPFQGADGERTVTACADTF
jgi:hypothetical protein